MWRLAIAAIVVACLFGAVMRGAWLAEHQGAAGSVHRGHRLLTTADAYFFASGVQREVRGTLADNPRVPGAGDSLVVAMGAGVVALTGLPVEVVCLWLPACLAPLVAVPLVLLGLLLGHLAWGFLASLVAVLGYSYWYRTVPGYFDTDMVTITFVTGIAVLLVAGFLRRSSRHGSVAAALVTIAPYVHPGSERVAAALTMGVLAYTLVLSRREPHAYRTLLVLCVALLPAPTWLRLLLIAAFELAALVARTPLWGLVSASAIAFVLALVTSPSMDLVLNLVGIHLRTIEGPNLPGVSFPGIGETVAELANPDMQQLVARVAGHGALLATGVLGFLAAAWRFRPLLLLAPLLALGTVLATGALRYTIFAVPVVALGNAWLAWLAASGLASRFARRRQQLVPRLRAGIAAALMAIPLGVAVDAALAHPAKTAVYTPEAEMLSSVSLRVSPGDFVVTWWDYAYGVWYHTGANTIVDGTKQNQDLWLVAELLFTSSQREAAMLARLAAEAQARQPPLEPVVDDIIHAWRATSGDAPLSDFVSALREGRVSMPAPTRQVFVYLPWRILQIAPNIATMRPAMGLVPETELGLEPFFVVTPMGPAGTRSPWRLDPQPMHVVGPRGERIEVRDLVDVSVDGGQVRHQRRDVHPDGVIHVVELRHLGTRVFMDRVARDSVLGQLLVMGTPDPAYFEPVARGRGGAVFRVR